VLNGERYLAASIESILRQTHPLGEVLICDACSTDETPRIAAEFAARDPRVRVVRPPASAGRDFAELNWVIRQTIGEFVAIYHADDVYDATIVEREAAYLKKHRDVGAVFSLPRFLDPDGNVTGEIKLPPELEGVTRFDCGTLTEVTLRYKNILLSTPSAMLRRSVIDLVGGFDLDGYGAQADAEMWLRMVRSAPIGLVREHLFGYRFHPAQWSRRFHNTRTTREPFFRMMDYHLSQPGVRDSVTPDALTMYRFWEAKDETERAANALVLGDPVRARAILGASLVRPFLRSVGFRPVARVLILKALVHGAARLGAGQFARRAVYWSRFRRRMPPDLKPVPESVCWSLDDNSETDRKANACALLAPRNVQVFVDPFSYHFLGNGLFDTHSKWNRDGSLRPWLILRSLLEEHGIKIDTADYLGEKELGRSTIVYSSFGIHDRFEKVLRKKGALLNSFYMFETVMYAPKMYAMLPELSEHFRSVYSWADTQTLSKYATGKFSVSPFRVPSPFSDVTDRYWSRTDRHGVLFVCSNRRGVPMEGDLFDDRIRAIEHFSEAGDFDLWGRGWDNQSGLSPDAAAAVRKSWRGPLADKYEAYSRAQFVVCFENQILPGYITEKIFDCFRAGAVPLYLGAPDVNDWVPSDCFVDVRKFASFEELSEFMAALTSEEITRYRVAARDFFKSEAFRPFSAEMFAERFLRDVQLQIEERQSRGSVS
jgi:glycosyltransferase involved in cell wall biosynthesis